MITVLVSPKRCCDGIKAGCSGLSTLARSPDRLWNDRSMIWQFHVGPFPMPERGSARPAEGDFFDCRNCRFFKGHQGGHALATTYVTCSCSQKEASPKRGGGNGVATGGLAPTKVKIAARFGQPQTSSGNRLSFLDGLRGDGDGVSAGPAGAAGVVKNWGKPVSPDSMRLESGAVVLVGDGTFNAAPAARRQERR